MRQQQESIACRWDAHRLQAAGWAVAAMLAAAALSLPACTMTDRSSNFDHTPDVPIIPSPYAASAAYRGTIGSITYYEGLRNMRVRGYGIVVGLGRNGTSDCPKKLRESLVQTLYKQHSFSSPRVGERHITPEEMLDDRDTAIVLVEGEIPPGATPGSTFDLFVRAIPDTKTKSLHGGRLYTADLHIYRPVSASASITGKILAKGAGPLFLNPFAGGGQAATRINPLEGQVLSGGVVLEQRRVQLVLSNPSYSRAKLIQERVNDVFGTDDLDVADAISPSFVRIQIPPKYYDDATHFLGLIRALALRPNPRLEAQRARALVQELQRPDAPHELISLALEAIGRGALPEISPLYADRRDFVSFYAAATGVRLGDRLAIDALGVHAHDEGSRYRYQAIRGLGVAIRSPASATVLRTLLDDPDPRIAIAVYEELVKRNDYRLIRVTVGEDNYQLDVVPRKGEPFIYARRSKARRIAIFGDDLKIVPPLFYRSPDGAITMTAEPTDDDISLVRLTPYGDPSGRLSGSLMLDKLIAKLGADPDIVEEKVTGLALPYDVVVRAICSLCADGAIPARFIMEEPNVAELFGPQRRKDRPEAEF